MRVCARALPSYSTLPSSAKTPSGRQQRGRIVGVVFGGDAVSGKKRSAHSAADHALNSNTHGIDQNCHDKYGHAADERIIMKELQQPEKQQFVFILK